VNDEKRRGDHLFSDLFGQSGLERDKSKVSSDINVLHDWKNANTERPNPMRAGCENSKAKKF
jgi:hypothetical protein